MLVDNRGFKKKFREALNKIILPMLTENGYFPAKVSSNMGIFAYKKVFKKIQVSIAFQIMDLTVNKFLFYFSTTCISGSKFPLFQVDRA